MTKRKIVLYTEPSLFGRFVEAGARLIGRGIKYNGFVDNKGYDLTRAVGEGKIRILVKGKAPDYDRSVPAKTIRWLEEALYQCEKQLDGNTAHVQIVGKVRGLDAKALGKEVECLKFLKNIEQNPPYGRREAA